MSPSFPFPFLFPISLPNPDDHVVVTASMTVSMIAPPPISFPSLFLPLSLFVIFSLSLLNPFLYQIPGTFVLLSSKVYVGLPHFPLPPPLTAHSLSLTHAESHVCICLCVCMC